MCALQRLRPPIGILVHQHSGNTIRRNSIFGHSGAGIEHGGGGGEIAPPTITGATRYAASGMACAGCTIDIYSDAGDEGKTWEGMTITDAEGSFHFTINTIFTGPNLAATATGENGSTSAFSTPHPLPPPPPRRRPIRRP